MAAAARAIASAHSSAGPVATGTDPGLTKPAGSTLATTNAEIARLETVLGSDVGR